MSNALKRIFSSLLLLLAICVMPTAYPAQLNVAYHGVEDFSLTEGTSPQLVAAILPSSRSVQLGTSATAFATMINIGTTVATSCDISPITTVDATFDFQATDPATNVVTGTANTAVDIPAGSVQTFVLAFTPTAAFPPTDVQLRFQCSNTGPAPVTSGLNTLLLSASNAPIPDIVALAATLQNDGAVHLNDTGVFAVATVNVGATGSITVSADTGDTSLPVALSLCETNPTTGSCLSSIGNRLTITIDANTTPTFGVFVDGTGDIPFDPAINRIFVRFRDVGDVTRGATSVAVVTSGLEPLPPTTENVLRLDYEGFTVWLDCDKRGAVKFQYNAQHDTGNHERHSSFYIDPEVSADCQQTSTRAYGEGHDRGHLVPANHLDYSELAIEESNFMVNILPQVAAMNRGAWLHTEEIVECYRDIDELLVIGGVFWGDDSRNDLFLDSHGVVTTGKTLRSRSTRSTIRSPNRNRTTNSTNAYSGSRLSRRRTQSAAQSSPAHFPPR